MGSINCKEYVTTKNDNNTRGEDPTGDGPVGSYQLTSESTPKKMSDRNSYTDLVTVCNIADIHENEMKQLDLDEDNRILLIKQNGRLRAIGNKCTHYGAPLHTGVLSDGRVRCPWHGACFNIDTGDIEDFPGLDSLPCYDVQVEQNGEVKVRAKRSDLEKNKRIKQMSKRDPKDERVFIVVGAGPSGATCAETLRQQGFNGRLVMVNREAYLPYDRVKVSKNMTVAIDSIEFRSAAFYDNYDIEIMSSVFATKLDTIEKTLHCSNGYSLKYDKIYIATGCTPFRPPIPGIELENVETVREYADAAKIMSFVNANTKVVCLGSSFIALESAAFLVGKVASVTVVGRDNVPLKPALGEVIGERILRLFQEKSVEMVMNSGIAQIIGNDNGKVAEVELIDGSILSCDLLIVGTGSTFNTEFLKDSGIQLNPNGTINTNTFLMSNVPDVYVGGDIANAYINTLSSDRVNIGHYQLAQYHGKVAGTNMAGSTMKLRTVPFFFTLLFGKGIRYAGHGRYSDVIIDGDIENFKYLAYYINDNGSVVAVSSCGRDPIVAQFAELISQGKCLNRSDVENAQDPPKWCERIKDFHNPELC